jgi:hypothetical protein
LASCLVLFGSKPVAKVRNVRSGNEFIHATFLSRERVGRAGDDNQVMVLVMTERT